MAMDFREYLIGAYMPQFYGWKIDLFNAVIGLSVSEKRI